MNNPKIHGTVVVLLIVASICYLSLWFGAAIIIGGIGMVIELFAWIIWIHGKIYGTSDEHGEPN